MAKKQQTDMTEHQAAECVADIQRGWGALREQVWSLHFRRGWKALGYDSWAKCIVKEFPRSERQIGRLLQAAKIAHELPAPTTDPIKSGHLIVLAKLPKDERDAAWRQVQAAAPDGKITTSQVHRVVSGLMVKEPSQVEKEPTQVVPTPVEAGQQLTDPLKDIQSRLSLIRRELKDAGVTPMGVFLDDKQISALLGTALAYIRAALPFGECPYCGGNKCKECRQQGWLPKELYQVSPKELKNDE
jgi:hypothetical protein